MKMRWFILFSDILSSNSYFVISNKHYVTSIRDQEIIRFCFYHWFQIRKETEKAFVPKVVISAAKAKEQETRITGEITKKQEQKQITQETVSPIL